MRTKGERVPIWRSSLIAWSFVCLYAGLIFYLSSLSSPPDPGIENDKLVHMGEYALLTLLLLWAVHLSFVSFSERALLGVSLLLVVTYGILDEIHQAFVPGRDTSLGDVIADALGALVVCVIWVIVRKVKSNE